MHCYIRFIVLGLCFRKSTRWWTACPSWSFLYCLLSRRASECHTMLRERAWGERNAVLVLYSTMHMQWVLTLFHLHSVQTPLRGSVRPQPIQTGRESGICCALLSSTSPTHTYLFTCQLNLVHRNINSYSYIYYFILNISLFSLFYSHNVIYVFTSAGGRPGRHSALP